MNSRTEVSITGFSSVASLASLLLAKQGIVHSYHIKGLSTPWLQQHPLSNPLVNGPTGCLENDFISRQYLQAVKYISNYESISMDQNFKPYRITKGCYKSQTYALDNRIRLHCFTEKIKRYSEINLIEHNTGENLILKAESPLNIIGGGEHFSSMFEKLDELPVNGFNKKRDLFFFNLSCDISIYSKYSHSVKIFYINTIGEVLIYPFLHVSGKLGINVTVNVIKGNRWDCFRPAMNSKQAFEKLMELVSSDLRELANDFKDAGLMDVFFALYNTSPYYKNPVRFKGNKLFAGVGESVTKNDPLIGLGYNSGADMAAKLVSIILSNSNCNIDTIGRQYADYACNLIKYLYHINRTSTQGNENAFLEQLYGMAVRNKPLRDFLFSTFDDISLYFPWLTDEQETQKLIKIYQEKDNYKQA